jgi:hypothetical protein
MIENTPVNARYIVAERFLFDWMVNLQPFGILGEPKNVVGDPGKVSRSLGRRLQNANLGYVVMTTKHFF